MANKIFILAAVILVAGCAHTEPTIKTVIQKVEIPISVPCKAEIPVKPDFNFDKLTEANTIFEKSQSALADLELHKGYEAELLGALKSCK